MKEELTTEKEVANTRKSSQPYTLKRTTHSKSIAFIIGIKKFMTVQVNVAESHVAHTFKNISEALATAWLFVYPWHNTVMYNTSVHNPSCCG